MMLTAKLYGVDASLWLIRIREEYREMPGLSLTQRQIQRLWGLEPHLCELVVESLMAARVVRRTPSGQYVAYADATSR